MNNMAVIFDFGGVLVDWNPHHLYEKLIPGGRVAVEQFLAEIGFRQWNLSMDAGLPFARGVAELSARFPQHAELIRAYDERFEEAIPDAIWPVVRILERLKAQGTPLYGLSNFSREKFALTRARFSFFEWFDGMVISGEVGLTKPDPAIYALALELAGLPAERCVFIDDSAENAAGAARLGLHAIHYRTPEELAGALAQLGMLDAPA
jgi:2-haloacid dehalogenase